MNSTSRALLAAASSAALAHAGATALRAATLDLVGGQLSYAAEVGVPNTLVISLANGTYTVDDPAESAVTPVGNSLSAGCSVIDANTMTCPEQMVSSFNINLGDQIDTLDMSSAVDPAGIFGSTGNDVIHGGLANDIIIWQPGNGGDQIDGGGGTDVLLFQGSNVAEQIMVTPAGTGFHIFRDIGTVNLDALSVEVLDLSPIGGDDVVTTGPLAATTQVFDGGTQFTADTFNFDARHQCMTPTTGLIVGTGFAPVLYDNFETINVGGGCVPLFGDGFEGGTTNAWSSTVG